jgi:uncharacterized membrane protein
MEFIKRSHRFLADQSFYPIAVASLYAMVLYFGRALFSGSPLVYANLVWNLFLAWIPYFLSMMAYALITFSRPRWWLLGPIGIVWLLFFPNAPYILTDFFHLDTRPGIPLWYDTLLLVVFSWTGIFLAMSSLRTMQRIVQGSLGRIASWLFALSAIALGAVGIYLGRFERWNSWDMLSHPTRILRDILRPLLDPLDSPRFFGFSILFMIFLLICYLVFLSFDLPDNRDRPKN